MISVVLSLPKQIIFVVLGDPSSKGKTGAKIGKVIAVGVLVLITLYGTRWIYQRIVIAKREIEAERNADILAKERQQGLPLRDPETVNAADMQHMTESERREWQQQAQMDRERYKKPEQVNTYVQAQ